MNARPGTEPPSPPRNRDSLASGTRVDVQTIQHSMKKNISAAQDLKEKITVGGFTPESYESSVLRRLLNESRPKAPKRQELMKAREGVEMARFRVDLLLKEKARKLDALHKREKFSASLQEENEDRGGKRSFVGFIPYLVS